VLARGAVLGARGNSGTILAQLLRGLADQLAGHEPADGPTFALAMQKAAESAYTAVADPEEGTFLTVARGGARAAVEAVDGGRTELAEVVRAAADGARAALDTTTDQLAALQRECRKGYVDPSLVQYAVKVVSATREPDRYGIKDMAKYLQFGASPRGSIHLIEGARALAFLRGRDYVLPQDVTDLVPDVLRHRLVLSYEALAEGLTSDQILMKVMQQIPAPDKPLEAHVRVGPQL